MKRLICVLGLMLFATAIQAKVVGEEVGYRSGETVLKGYLAFDDAVEGKRPGVLVVHEWWGHNEYARVRAEMLAEEGYTALAVDMYGDGKQAAHPDDAGKFAAEVRSNMPQAEARFRAAMKLLQGHRTVDSERIAAIGYCFGGGIVLEMARRGVALDGVASFHGSLGSATPDHEGKVKAKVLVLNGADDPFVKPEQIAAFKQEMERAGADYRLINYPGAKHSFTNPQADRFGEQFGMPLAYNESADKASWAELTGFLERLFAED